MLRECGEDGEEGVGGAEGERGWLSCGCVDVCGARVDEGGIGKIGLDMTLL